jgi:hypothetical protein
MEKQERTGNPAFATSDANIITHQNEQQLQNSNMLASQLPARRDPSVTTDQYHHSETIWRIVLDIISLIICKYFSLFSKILIEFIFSIDYNTDFTLCCYTVYTRIFLFGFIDKVSI